MKHLISKVAACLALSLFASGCELYLGEHRGRRDTPGSWVECRNDGAYQCSVSYGETSCYWFSSTCDDTIYECKTSADCAAGCYCAADGTCQEAGFCASDSDCGPGFKCEVDRSACVPDTNECNRDADCEMGKKCDVATHTCVPPVPPACGDARVDAGEVCDDGNKRGGDGCSADCKSNEQCGNGIVDASKGETCDDANLVNNDGCSSACKIETAGSCAGAITCNIVPPVCASNKVPLIKDGCYTGECALIDQCDVPPVCSVIRSENACAARSDCDVVYTGINCRRPDGAACRAGDAQCVCERFTFNSCVAAPN